ncbi:MAG: hypothetical protein M3O67_03665 [Bacteroidota bacterium]|nr:hypothetical protein [Bacteroidota bacterium]
MKKIRKLYGVMLFLLIASAKLYAQTSDSGLPKETKPQFKISINYNTHLNYYGRTDSLQSSGVFPLAEVWFTPDFYVNAAPIFVNNSLKSFDYAGTVATAGYQFNSNNKWLGNFYVLKPFYKESSELVQSVLKAQGSASLTLLNNYLNVTAGGDVKFSDKPDFGATAGLDHIFRVPLSNEMILVFDPSAYLYAGTQQFSKSYYKKSNFLFLSGNEQQVTEFSSKFNILAYEFSVPVIFSNGKFQLLATPAYIVPQNLITVPGRPDLSERGKEMFYATIAMKVSF